MSVGTGNSAWSDLFASFHSRHRDPKGKRLTFTVVFNTAIESLMVKSEVPLEWRVLAFIWRMSWGHSSDFAVDRIGGKQIGQTRCAEAPKSINGGSVTRWLCSVEWVTSCPGKGKRCTPAIADPARVPAQNQFQKSGPLRTFQPFWRSGKSRPQRTFRN